MYFVYNYIFLTLFQLNVFVYLAQAIRQNGYHLTIIFCLDLRQYVPLL